MTTLSFWKIHSTFLPVHLRIVNGMSFLGAVFVKQGHLEVLLLCSGINAGLLKRPFLHLFLPSGEMNLK